MRLSDMTNSSRSSIYHRHRFPPDVIAHAVWLYFRFPLSLRMVEDLLAQRGIIVSHQTVRMWAEKFGASMPGISVADLLVSSIENGISTRSLSQLVARNTGCGALWIRTALSLMCWYKVATIPKQLSG